MGQQITAALLAPRHEALHALDQDVEAPVVQPLVQSVNFVQEFGVRGKKAPMLFEEQAAPKRAR